MTTWTRIGSQNGKLYLDLCDEAGRAVEIDAQGWHLVAAAGLPFVRSDAMQALPAPAQGDACSIDELRPFLGARGETDFRLAVAWLLRALGGGDSYPILILDGGTDADRAALALRLRSLVDPSALPALAAPSDDELMTRARAGRVLAVEGIRATWFGNALCRLATGGGIETADTLRSEDVVPVTVRPIILAGGASLADRFDVMDRAVTVHLAPIAGETDGAWEAARPRILAALCDAPSTAVWRLPEVRLTRPPRLIDFAKWVTAAEPGLAWEDGAFIEAWQDRTASAVRPRRKAYV